MREGTEVGRLFCERWGEKTRSAAARKALEAMIPNSPTADLPVNVEAAARYVGIDRIVDLDASDCDGSLSVTPTGSYVAGLRRGQSQTRRRFTLAHEVGHCIVFHSIRQQYPSAKPGQMQCRSQTPEEKDEERLCDILAAELLMPRARFLQTMNRTGVSATTVPDIARLFDVSLQAASRRVAQLLPYDIGVGVWTLSDDARRFVPKWYLNKTGAISIEYVIEAGQPGSACFESQAVRGWHWIPLQGQMDKYFVDVSPLRRARNAWLVLVMYSDAAQQIMATISKGRPDATMEQLSLVS